MAVCHPLLKINSLINAMLLYSLLNLYCWRAALSGRDFDALNHIHLFVYTAHSEAVHLILV